MSQPEYDPGQYGPPPPAYHPYLYQPNYSLEYAQGQRHKDTSLVLGIIGLFVIGIILGPLAIVKANQAEALGVKATAGKTLGWVDTIISGLGVLFFLISFGL